MPSFRADITMTLRVGVFGTKDECSHEFVAGEVGEIPDDHKFCLKAARRSSALHEV